MPSDLVDPVDLPEAETVSDADTVGGTAGTPDDNTAAPECPIERCPPGTQKLKRRLHSIRDVSDQAHTSHATTWRLIKRGVLKTVKIGRRTFITDESLERLVAEGAP